MFELSYQPIEDAWFYLLVAFILEALAVYVWRYHQSPGAVPFAASLVNRSIWLISLVIIGTTSDYESKLFWSNIQQVAASLPIVFWLVFMLQMTHRWERGKRRNWALLFVPALSWLLLFTNPWHGWYWTQVSSEDAEVLTFARGMGNLLMVSYDLLLMLPVLYYIVQWLRECSGLRRRQAIIITLSPVISMIGTFIWMGMQHTCVLSPLPLSSLVSGVAWTYGFFYLRLFNLLPLAQAAAVEIMGNCLAVVDTEGWVVDLNAAGARSLGITPAQAIGKPVDEVFSNWTGFSQALAAENAMTQELCLEKNNQTTYYELHCVQLADQRGQILGQTFVWKDITVQKQEQLQLMEQEKALSILTERNRIGREIHDGRGQLGGYFQMELQTIQVLLEKNQPEKAKLHVERLSAMAREYNTDVRETIAGLKIGSATAKQDFLTILQEYLDGYEKRYGISTEINVSLQTEVLSVDIFAEVQLLRIIQEALNNICKHAKAKRVQISIWSADGKTSVCVADDGQGFDTSGPPAGKNHYGLGIMKERAEEAGGEFQVESQPGGGTKVTVRLFS